MKIYKKIAIFGSYNGSSIGDTAILLGLLSSIERIYGSNVEVNVLVMNHIDLNKECEQLKIKLDINEIVITEFAKATDFISSIILFYKKVINKFFFKQVVKTDTVTSAIKGTNHLLIGGGNLIMDLYPKSPELIQKICDIAIVQNIKYSFIGIGAGPIDTQDGREIFQNSLQNAEYVFLRDKKSLSLVQNKFTNIKFLLIPDLALGLKTEYKTSENRDTLLINVASVYGKGWPIENEGKFRNYIYNLVKITKDLITSNKFQKVKLFYSNYPLDTVGGKAYADELKKENIDIEIINKKLSVSEIITLATHAKLTFVTRLHAGIMAYHGRSFIAAVCYQPKVKDVLQESGITDCIFDPEFVNRKKITQQIIDLLDNKPETQSQTNMKNIDKAIINILGTK